MKKITFLLSAFLITGCAAQPPANTQTPLAQNVSTISQTSADIEQKTANVQTQTAEIAPEVTDPYTQAAPASENRSSAQAVPASENSPAAQAASVDQAPAPAQAAPSASGNFMDSQEIIGEENAKNIALSHFGISADAVTRIHVGLDYDYRPEYEVEFYDDRFEYEVSIDALSGEVREFSSESIFD